jgi:hypothetical protein
LVHREWRLTKLSDGAELLVSANPGSQGVLTGSLARRTPSLAVSVEGHAVYEETVDDQVLADLVGYGF